MVDVQPTFDILADRAYCSIECMCYDGIPIVKKSAGESPIEKRYAYCDPRNEL